MAAKAGGGYRVGKVTFPTYSSAQGGLSFDATGITMTGLTIPAPNEADPVKALMLYDTFDLAGLAVKQDGTDVFTMSDVNFKMDRAEGGEPMKFTGGADHFKVDFTSVPDPRTKEVMSALGYTTLNGSIAMDGSYQPTSGRVSLTQYDFVVDDAGTLGITMELGGYTPAFIKSLQDMQRQMASQPEGADNSAQGLAMLGLMQQLEFGGLSISFEDDSLTGKVIDYVAKTQNVSPDDIRNQAKAVIPFATAQLNNPELSSQVVNAVNAFLDDPKSIVIAATPASPIPFSQVAATGMANPLELTKTLGVTVKANEATP